MLAFHLTGRCFHTGLRRFGVDKSSLSKLRKKTGFSFMHCKNALEKFDNDLDQAEKWLRDQAQKEGWARATKLQGRPMSQGLVSILRDTHMATMMEVNCETDFVAKNSKFHDLVSRLTLACHENFQKADQTRTDVDKDILTKFSSQNGQTIGDLVAVEVGNIGENIAARRAVCLRGGSDLRLDTYIHLAGPEIKTNSDCIMGRFGALVALKQVSSENPAELSLEESSQLICQHIVGMNPKLIGEPDEEVTNQEASSQTDPENNENDEDADGEDKQKSKPKEDETRLIHQEYLLDPSITVGEFLSRNGVEVFDFVRFECGEDLGENKD